MPAADASPPLAWSGVPENACALALIVEDVDVPFPRPFVHAVAYGIDPATTNLAAGALDATPSYGAPQVRVWRQCSWSVTTW